MDGYGDGGSMGANPTGAAVFDASQYAFFGNEVLEEVELGGLENEDDLTSVGFNEEFQLEREEVDCLESLSEIDDLSSTFSKLNKVGSGPTSAGGSGHWGSRESSSAAEWAHEPDFPNWLDQHGFDPETNHESKKWSSQPNSSNSLHRTSSYPEQQQYPHQLQNLHQYSTEPILIPKSPFISYPPPGGRSSPNGIPYHLGSSTQQRPMSPSNLSPFTNPQLQMNPLQPNGSQFGGNFRIQSQWMNQNSAYAHQNSLMPPQMIPHQQTRMQLPFQPSFDHLSGSSQSQLFNNLHISPSPPPMINSNFDNMPPDLRDQRGLSMPRTKPGPRYSHQGGSDYGIHNQNPRFKSKYMTADEIENILRAQHAATHTNDPYVDDYYHQSCLSRKYAGAKMRRHFCPTNLRDNNSSRANNTTAEPHPFLQVDALGRVSFSSIRRPRPLLEVDSANSSGGGDGTESKLPAEKTLEQEPMLAARVTIEDGICLLLDIDDIDRYLQFNHLPDGGAQLREKRQVLLEGLASSLQLLDPLGKNGGNTVDLALKDDLVFLRVVSLPKGRNLLLRYLQLLSPGGELARVVCMAVFRHLRFLFGNVPANPEVTTDLAKTVSFCVLNMELKALAACLASVVCSSENPPLRPIGSPAGDGASFVLKSVLERATEFPRDPNAASSCSLSNRVLWQASFDDFFGLLMRYCFNKYDSVLTSAIGPDVAKAIVREMPVQLLEASIHHTSEQQRIVLLEFAQRSMPVMGGESGGF